MKKPEPFSSEADMCADFISAVGKEWTAYAETCGWDILLSRNSDGFQIGIQAKLKLNAQVIAQAIERNRGWSAEQPGPDYRAVLVPFDRTGHFEAIAAYIGITIIRVRPRQDRYGPRFYPKLPAGTHAYFDAWHEQITLRRHPLPEYIPDVRAGASAPLRLTPWKIAGIKIAVTLEIRGFVTRADFKAHGIDHRRWIAAGEGWLQPGNGGYVAGPRMPDFKTMHPRVYEEITADAEKWMPAALRLGAA